MSNYSEIPNNSKLETQNSKLEKDFGEFDCRSLEDIKKLVERKADVLDGVMLDAGGVMIGLYFAIANDLPSVTPQEPVLDKIRAEIKALTSNRGFLSCSVDYIHEEIDAVFDKYKAESEAEDGNDD